MRIAVIDLGTNTCNLLIAELNSSGYSILHQSKEYVKLGDGKITTNEISDDAIERVKNAFENHKKIIEKLNAQKVRCIATSAIRSAINKIDFLNQIGNKSGWTVKVISGEKEAELIFKGVLLAIGSFQKPSVILDIGGGSNELILAKNKKMLWKESQPTGMGRVINRFAISDPIQPKEIEQLAEFFREEHKIAIEECTQQNVFTLVGCSGAFDTLADMIDQVDPGEKQRISKSISLDEFYSVFNNLIKSTRKERIDMKGMDMMRVDLIVPAIIFIELLISGIGINDIVQTDYALREGVLFETMEKMRSLTAQK